VKLFDTPDGDSSNLGTICGMSMGIVVDVFEDDEEQQLCFGQ
jgi:hypothetical protein